MRPGFEEPAAVLRQAAAVMKAMQPALTVHFHRYGVAYRARFEFPGVLLVYCRNTGELIAKSRRGRPCELATRRA